MFGQLDLFDSLAPLPSKQPPKRVAPHGCYVTDAQVERLLTFEGDCVAETARGRGMVGMMAHCGLRRSEVASIDLDCVDLGGGGLVVPDSKRDAHRWLPLRDSVVQSLQVWREYRGDGPGPLFCGISQQQVLTRARLSGEGVRWILGHIVARTRADYLSPIDLRRYFCTSRLEAGADLLAVSRLMGHASVETTMRYDMRGRRCLRDAVDMVRPSAPVDLRLGEEPAPYGHGFEKVA